MISLVVILSVTGVSNSRVYIKIIIVKEPLNRGFFTLKLFMMSDDFLKSLIIKCLVISV